MPRKRRTRESGHDPISVVSLDSITPSPENDTLYRPVDPADQEIRALAESIRRHGLKEPIVITLDGFILSGHRRHCACKLAGLTEIPVRVEPIRRLDDIEAFIVQLREHNRQRDKSLDEKLREEVVTADPAEAYRCLIDHRRKRALHDVDTIPIRARRRRPRISKAKRPFLEAVLRVLDEQRDFWPLSDRRIHYALLNDPPLKHASKPDSTYQNDQKSYKSLVDLLTRARLEGTVWMRAIDDDTRPQTTWTVWPGPREFIRRELGGLLKGYYRDLQRSQPAHIEIVVEKNTVKPIVHPVAEEFCIPITSGRGYCSLPPRAAIASRFERSGKDRLCLLIASDFDPDGEEIAHSLARSLRDDFDIECIDAVKVALTAEQVEAFNLPPKLKAKQTSSRYQRFADSHGDDVFELEAIPPAELQRQFREAIDNVMDIEAFNAELDAEREDAALLDEARQRVHASMRGIVSGGGSNDA